MSDLARLYRERVLRGIRGVAPERRHFRRDLVAGLPGAISSVPDGMASSVLAGVNPAHGLYASFAGPVAGGLGSSTRLMVVTTTSAAALAAGSAVATYDGADRSDAMILLTLLTGLAMLLAAVLRLSRLIRFVSYSVMLGFLTGVAVNMVLGQLGDATGIDAPGEVAVTRAARLLLRLDEADLPTLGASLTALALLVLLGRTRLSVVSSLVALVVPTVAVLVLGADSVASVADSGAIPQGLPLPGIPDLSLLRMELVGGALSVAALVLVQGAGVAEAVPNPDGSPSSTRRDFVAQGVGNLASGLFGGQPVGGSVGQTALNVAAGARSRWAGIWSGLWMGAILVVFAGAVGEVAMPTLAAVLIYAGVGAVRPRELATVVRTGTIPAAAVLATFVAVLVLPVAAAVGVGVIASLVLQLNQDALDLRLVRLVRDPDGAVREEPVPERVAPGDVVVLNVYGSLFYAGARTLQRRLPPVGPGRSPDGVGPVVVLRMRGRTTLGATFWKVAGDYAGALHAAGGHLFLTGVEPRLVERWEADGLAERYTGVRLFPAEPVLGASTAAALAAAGADLTRVSPPGWSPPRPP